jgi:hypothetical protein
VQNLYESTRTKIFQISHMVGTHRP